MFNVIFSGTQMVEGYPVRSSVGYVRYLNFVTVEIFTNNIINQFSPEFATCINIKDYLRFESSLSSLKHPKVHSSRF
jgi:hypothetical protein